MNDLVVNELIESGFENIVLAGHSCGAWATLNLTGRFHDKIKGSIAMNPACRGRISDRTKKIHGLHGVLIMITK